MAIYGAPYISQVSLLLIPTSIGSWLRIYPSTTIYTV